MTKSQEQRMNELAEKHYKNTGHVPTEWAVLNFQAGYTAAMKEAEELAEALEDYHRAYIFLLRGREHILVADTREALKKFKGEYDE